MTIEIRVPALGESVTEATVGQWFKKPGEAVQADEPVVELETEKAAVEVPAPTGGVLGEIRVEQGTAVAIGTVLGTIKEGAAKESAAAAKPELARQAAPAENSAAAQGCAEHGGDVDDVQRRRHERRHVPAEGV